jgi:acyl-CoA synthetase (AMP-forming)/AMP-acid ligase II
MPTNRPTRTSPITGKDAARRAIECDGLASVGDMGYVDDEGFLYVCDRTSDMVISGGANIYPAEIEHVLITLPGIADCAVVGIPDDEFGEALAAQVVAEDGGRRLMPRPSASELGGTHCRLQGAAPYRRRRCPAARRQRQAAEAPHPRSLLERQVATDMSAHPFDNAIALSRQAPAAGSAAPARTTGTWSVPTAASQRRR